MRRQDCFDKLKDVKGCYEAAIRTLREFIRIAQQEPSYLHENDLNLTELRLLLLELRGIYFTRLFASFESSLRHFWRTTIRETKPLTEQLINALAGRLGVRQDTLDSVHEIRAFRNHLIHEENEDRQQFVITTIDEASKHLNTFFSRLPLEW